LIFDQFNTFENDYKDEEKKIEVVREGKKSLSDIYEIVLKNIFEDYIVFFNLNGSQNEKDIPMLVSRIKLGYDLVTASRFLHGGKRYDDDYVIPFRGFGNRLITFLLNIVFNANLTDSYQPFRAVSRQFLVKARLNSKNLSNYQMSIRAVTTKQKISEIPTQESKSVNPDSFFTVAWNGLLLFNMVLVEKVKQCLTKK